MTQKRFTLLSDGETIIDNESVVDDGGKEIYWTVEYVQVVKLVELLNELHEENKHYKSLFFEIVETALTDKNCRELYCEGILNVFNKSNSLNQAREQIKEFLK